jgi:hypothetical protein
METRSTCFVAFLVAGSLFFPGRTGAADFSRAAIDARLDAIQNLTAEYNLREDHDEDPIAWRSLVEQGVAHGDRQRTDFSAGVFSFLYGSAKLESLTGDQTLKYWAEHGVNTLRRQVITIDPSGREEQLHEIPVRGRVEVGGGVEQITEFPLDWTVDLALGLRLFGEREWLTKQALAAAEQLPPTDPEISTLEFKQSNGNVDLLRFDRRLLYALVSERCTFPEAPDSFVEITNSNFRREDNVFLPMSIDRQRHYIDLSGKPRDSLVCKIVVSKYILNDPDNTESRFRTIWPARIRIYDARVRQAIDVGPTSRPLSDDDIREQLDQREASQREIEGQATQRIHKVVGAPATAPASTDHP